MPLQPSDYFVVNRAKIDYKYEYSALVADLNIDLDLNDGKIQFNAGDGLAELGDNATANQEADTLKTFSVKTASGITIDANGNVIIDPNFDLGTEEHGIGDGAIAFDAGDGLAETGTNATANQLGDTLKTFSVKTASGITIDANGNVIIDPNFDLTTNGQVGDAAIEFNAGDGLAEVGTNATANQTVATLKTFSVKTADGITIDVNGNVIIDPNFDLSGNVTFGDGAIEFNAGDGLAETGTNATANQTGDTAKTFSVKTGDGIIIDVNGNVAIDPSFNLDGNITAPGDGAINVNAGLGLEATGDNATANQTTGTTRVLSAKTADGITIDSNGNIIIDPSFNLDGNITPPGDGRITINSSDGSKVGEFTVNQTGPTTITLPEILFPESLHPSGFIDVSQPAPASPEHGDIYIQHRIDLADAVADASFNGIAGRTVTDGQFVMFGVDDLWHAGGDAAPTEHQADWAQTDASAIDYIKNKPDLQAEVDRFAGDGAINVNAGPGIEATGDNATANQKTDTTRTLAVKTAGGITIDSNGNVIIDPSFNLDGNITAPGDGAINFNAGAGLAESGVNATANQTAPTTKTFSVKTGGGIIIDGGGNVSIDPSFNLDGNVTAPNDGVLTVKDHAGATVGTFTANQAGNTDVTLPKGFSGDYNDLINAPDINDGKFGIKDSGGTVLGEFTANQKGDTEVILPAGFSGDYNDLINQPDINDGKLTIKDDEGNVVGEFTANQAGGTEVVLPSSDAHWDDIEGKPCIPECKCPEFTAGHPCPNPKDGEMFSDTSQCPPKLFIYSEEKSRWIAVGDPCPVDTPWAGHDGGIFHIVNNRSGNFFLPSYKGPYKSWNPDGTNESTSNTIPANSERVIATGPDISGLFVEKYGFKFGEHTDVSRVTNMDHLFEMSYFDDPNRNMEGWSVCNVTCMRRMFYNMDNRVRSDLSNWGVENCPDPEWSKDYNPGFLGTEPKWGEPNGPCSCKGDSSYKREADPEQEEWEDYLKRKAAWEAVEEQKQKEQVD